MTRVAQGVGADLERVARRPTPRAAPPELESFADDLYDALYPLAWLDAQTDYHLAKYIGAIGAMFQPVADVARDTTDGPGWSAVLDLSRCPEAWLPWLAQFVGVTLIPGASAESSRERIAGTDGFHRGTPAAIRTAAQATLTGTRTVYFRERDPSGADPPYTLEVTTRIGETPDPAATTAAILAQKPGGIVLSFRTVDVWDYQEMTLRDGTYAAQSTAYLTYADLAIDKPKVTA